MPEALPEALSATQDFSLFALFLRADPIVKAVMIILALASVWSWAVALDKWFTVMAVRSRAKRLEQAFWAGQPLEDMDGRVGDRPAEAMARVFSAGQREWRDSRRGQPGDEANRHIVERASASMDAAINRETQRLESGLPTLAIIASSTPFIGLFGTVIGIMNTFTQIGAMKDTSLSTVAPGIAEALLATGIGLAAAIPAILAYNKFTTDLSRYNGRLNTAIGVFSGRLSKRKPG